MSTDDRHRIDTAPTGEACRVAKVLVETGDDRLGLVIGYGAICKELGEDYWDEHGDHLSEEEMLKAATKFMRGARRAHVMHDDVNVGQVVFAFPLTTEIAKALELPEPKQTGLLIAWAPDDKSVLAKFHSGEWTGFSFGGSARRRRLEAA